jgi:hypothetical protein
MKNRQWGDTDTRHPTNWDIDEVHMGTTRDHRHSIRDDARYFTVGWVLLAVATLALAATILATAARPHVLWLFSTSYGAILMVVGVTLIRVGHRARTAKGSGHEASLEGCRT